MRKNSKFRFRVHPDFVTWALLPSQLASLLLCSISVLFFVLVTFGYVLRCVLGGLVSAMSTMFVITHQTVPHNFRMSIENALTTTPSKHYDATNLGQLYDSSNISALSCFVD